MTANDTRPNILWISFEDTSPRFGCYGDTVARTPNVDQLAAEGCIYPNTFSCAGVCAPSRFAVITGTYPQTHGAHHMRTTNVYKKEGIPGPYDAMVPHTVRCFTEYLRMAGYYCSNNSKTDYQFVSPTAAWDDCSNQGHWRNRPDPDQPFFAVFNPTTTHESGMWPDKDGAVTPPDTNPADVTVPGWLPDTPNTREAIARQYDNIHSNDQLVGKLLQELEEDGLTENTIVMIWSDHGEGLPRAKRWLYDSGIRVPMIVKWPGQVAPGETKDQLVSLLDLAPTLLNAAGIAQPRVMPGQPFCGPGADRLEPRHYVHGGRDRFDCSYDMVRSVRDQRFKYICNHRPELPRLLYIPYRNKHPTMSDIWAMAANKELTGPLSWFGETSRPVEEFYDLEQDPEELNNIIDDPAYAEEVLRLRAEHDGWCHEFDTYGEIDEQVMVQTWYPSGPEHKPTCETPLFIPLNASRAGTENAEHGPTDYPNGGQMQLPGPALLQLFDGTQGAAILWTDEWGADATWQLYNGPIRLREGRSFIRAKASRIGYQDSPESQMTLVVRG